MPEFCHVADFFFLREYMPRLSTKPRPMHVYASVLNQTRP